ncbi:hypothetical protein CALCODRAFT_489180 [Calocera cornea HHB12733]|uniref:Chromo shadow domain-containing protein n=1 Tax=Calocera cornea HHB12733 TaxID=1353952 RepID=A0A166JFN0_9BASI|nr:hypothetical protein CALCODRAFT_489180 [Calocera cornea HHB12733]
MESNERAEPQPLLLRPRREGLLQLAVGRRMGKNRHIPPQQQPHWHFYSFTRPPRKRKRDTDDEVEELQPMMKYLKQSNWEGLVEKVSDVRRGSGKGNKTLVVRLELTNGISATSSNVECNERCPQKMLAFYESKIRFAEVDE